MIGQAADTQRPQPIAALPNRGSHSRTPLLGGTPAPTPHPGTPKPRPLNQRRPRSCPGPPGWIGSPASRPVGVGALSTPARIGATGLQHRAHTGRRPRCGFIAAEPAANLGSGDRDQRTDSPRRGRRRPAQTARHTPQPHAPGGPAVTGYPARHPRGPAGPARSHQPAPVTGARRSDQAPRNHGTRSH